ncbi:MAG: VWA domain-containing protein [Pseudobdellovibrionaceae bacterium]|nr:VWA domain-containing protein [Pseudobdellovibrionaceae bacterium]
MRNFILIIDRSGSMGEAVGGGSHQARWDAARESVIAVARKCQELDPDGIDLYTFNTRFQFFPNTTAEKVAQIFREVSPMGGTDFIPVLTDAFEKHFQSDRPSTILIVTDGEPSTGTQGQKDLARLLVSTANLLEGDAELAVSFFQIGQDKGAAAFLRKLDDELQSAGAKFDIVDTKTFEDLETRSIEDILLAAVND